MAESKRVIVIGGGIIGLASAHFLAEAGQKVTVIDRGQIGAACSFANCGLISPSHVFPLPGPGAIRHGIAAMLKKNGPLRIKPGLNVRLWWWLTQFGLHCNLRDRMSGGHGRHALLSYSREFYVNFIPERKIDCDFEAKGCLMVHGSQKTLDEFDEINAVLDKEFDMGAQKLVGDELVAKEPAIKPNTAAGAWYYPQDAHLRPNLLVAGWKKLLVDAGVEFIESTSVAGFESHGKSKAGGVRVYQSPDSKVERLKKYSGKTEVLEADSFVVATGSWTPFLNRELGCSIPIQPGKGYSLTMQRPSVCPEFPMIFENEKVAITPMASGYRIGSTMEFVGYNNTLQSQRLGLLREGASKYLQEPLGKAVELEWFGWRPMTPNGLPRIDRSPRFKNVVVAAGHNMIGVMTAPATGLLVSELITGKEPTLDPRPYAIGRAS